jgi:small subunit ribosomal protein S22
MTAKQLEAEVRSKFKHAERLLQMPPVVKVMEEKKKVISTDPAMTNFSENSFVFTDVTFGLKNSDRSVVIRHPDGVLEDAPYSVRKRVYQIYFPMAGRKFRVPKMFEAENLKLLMANEEYEFILDRLCLQFEPYEPQFHEITAQIYQHVNENQKFDKLRSTRHFGPMAFFFAWHKTIDDLVLDMIRNDYLKNAVELICLMYKLNTIDADTSILKTLQKSNESERLLRSVIDQLLKKENIKKIDKTNEDLAVDELCFGFIQESFVKQHSLKKPQLELALQTYKERHNELKNIVAGVN